MATPKPMLSFQTGRNSLKERRHSPRGHAVSQRWGWAQSSALQLPSQPILSLFWNLSDRWLPSAWMPRAAGSAVLWKAASVVPGRAPALSTQRNFTSLQPPPPDPPLHSFTSLISHSLIHSFRHSFVQPVFVPGEFNECVLSLRSETAGCVLNASCGTLG